MKSKILNSACIPSSRILVSLFLATQIAVVSLYADETPGSPGQLSASDYKFACEAARGGKFEVDLGKIAAQKSSDSAVQQFGQRMTEDHGKAGDQLHQIASQKGATLPSDLTAAQQKHEDYLSTLSGTAFDKAYIAAMVKAHKADLKAFEHAAKDVQDSDLRSFAANTVPMIQDHLKMAENLRTVDKVAAAETK